MTQPCAHHKPIPIGYHEDHPKAEKGLEQRQCPTCLRWYFRGEFGKGWAKGIIHLKVKPMNDMYIVYRKGDDFKALNIDNAAEQEHALKADGWIQVYTIDGPTVIEMWFRKFKRL